MKTNRGRFIVLEGLDGCGGETQSKLLIEFLENQNIPCEKLSYPDYDGPIGQVIDGFLHNKSDFSPDVQAILYFADFLKDRENIEKWLQEGKVIVSDRYLTSTLAYQGLKQTPVDSILKLEELFKLPRPDAIIYIKISAETSADRKYKEKGNLDRHEADKEFMEKLSRFYMGLIDKKVLGEWVVVDGERPIPDVFEEIKKIVVQDSGD